MQQNNSNIPIVKVGDTIYELYGSYGNLCKRKVERITKTQIILDRGTKLRNKPLRMYGDENAYCLNTIRRGTWGSSGYYIETEKLIALYKHEQLYLKTKQTFESLDLKELTDDQLNTLLSTMTQIITKNKPPEEIKKQINE